MVFDCLKATLKIKELQIIMAGKHDSIYMVRYQAQKLLSSYKLREWVNDATPYSKTSSPCNCYEPCQEPEKKTTVCFNCGHLRSEHYNKKIETLEKFIARCDKVISKDRNSSGYNFEKDVCDRCGITKEEAKKYPVDTGIDQYPFRYSTRFYLSTDGTVKCAKCHKEEGLESLFKLMDAIDAKKAGENNG